MSARQNDPDAPADRRKQALRNNLKRRKQQLHAMTGEANDTAGNNRMLARGLPPGKRNRKPDEASVPDGQDDAGGTR